MSIPPVLPYLPQDLFSASNGLLNVPQVLIAPARYIQGSAVLSQLARYLALVPCKHPALLLSAGYLQRNGKPLLQQLRNAGLDAVTLPFNGECSTELKFPSFSGARNSESEKIVKNFRKFCHS
ncbi:MAG: hypothetical protein Q8Q50_10025 [Methylobacter sp.]|nr:hypothetical protein [Methylobacter sp.]